MAALAVKMKMPENENIKYESGESGG